MNKYCVFDSFDDALGFSLSLSPKSLTGVICRFRHGLACPSPQQRRLVSGGPFTYPWAVYYLQAYGRLPVQFLLLAYSFLAVAYPRIRGKTDYAKRVWQQGSITSC